ncbi:ROK family protein [Microlunatus speluncae]|uniref:ROK family protein n=1 Tax=Microlunatus speluncae TaxID=2594267 RepID=UPI0012666143|nr:ROK family protein [Microlunatus speluncae]
MVTVDSSRRRNLSAVLRLVHTRRGATRAELTRLTGLNRSTIGGLVTELAGLGLVLEADPAIDGVGRPSPRIEPNPDVVAVTVNPDIDAITVGLVGLDGRVRGRLRRATRRVPSLDRAVALATDAIDDLVAKAGRPLRVLGLGIAVPGLVRETDGSVVLAPHLGWRDAPVAAAFTAGTGLPARVANDARLAALAECGYGAGVGHRSVIYLNGSASGIGGGVVIEGRPLRGRSGFAGELGHTVVNPAGRDCHCGRRGCLETEVTRDRLLTALGLADADPETLDRRLLDPGSPARAEVARQLDWLAQATIDFSNTFDPELIILGGFLGSLQAADPERLAKAVRGQGFPALGTPPEVSRAALGPDLPVIGPAELIFAELITDPAIQRMLPVSTASAAR